MAAPLTKEEVEQYLGKVDLRGPLEEALNVAVSNLTMDPTGFLSGHFAAKKKAMDLGITPAMVGPCDGLLPQPTQGARFTTVLVEYNIPGHEGGVGGADKGKNGHRVDSIPIANGVIKTNNYCFPIKFVPADYALFENVVKGVDGIIVRINPGQMDGPTQTKFDNLMRECIKIGIPVWSSPEVQIQMGAKDALCKIAHLNCGLPDTLAYYTEDEFKAGFYKTMAYQPRVIKQNRGSSGEGIWIIKLKDREYCPTFGAAYCEDDWVLDMMEANDNHQEFHTCGEFVEFCLNGRTDKSGTWTSKGVGKYLEGGKEAGGQLVDQRFCPRIVEGEVRVLTSGPTCLQLIHKKPADGGISAVLGTGSVYTFYTPDEPKFAELKRKLFDEDLPKIMPALGLAGEPFPIIWTTDLIPYTDDDGKDQYTVGEFNCSCVGISKFQACAYPDKGLADVVGDDLAEATMVADYAGTAAIDALTMRNAAQLGYHTPFETGPMVGINPQPSIPTYKLLCVEYNIPGHPSGVGGADKGKHGHRVDSIPICNGVIKSGGSCFIIKYKPEAKEAFKKIVMGVDGLIVRINPGQMDGVNQDAFDGIMRECISAGIPVWSSPDVQIQMGAKDALCKIAHLNCGLPDTLAYYTEDEFKAGFYKTMAYQPRVIKQNRGSSGEGIWIIKLKDREYCPTFGAALCEDDWVLDMMEANDNHQEFHTCGEFVEFCLNGRTDKSGTWTSKGVGKYLEGGKEAGGQLVDQRFCPRIVEGEVRVLTSGPTCLQLIHKKPADGGISAVLGTGSVYTFYTPDEPKFAELKRKLFDEDLPKIMPALGLAGEPFPIIWTTDLIPYTDDDGKDQYTVGEFNCSCVGISKFQACAYPDKGIFDCKGADFSEAQSVANYAGAAAIAALDTMRIKKPTYLNAQVEAFAGKGPWTHMIGPCDGLMKQPVNPEYKIVLLEYFIPGHASGCGGYDKGKNGHRVDSIPIANGVIKAGSVCVPMFYVPEFHEIVKGALLKVDGIIVRINPGQLADNQDKFDALMRECISAGIPVWSSPDVQIQMGAKDALCKIAHLNCGLPDTLAYYTEDEFKAGFYKTMAYQPRVIKQNRGSSGEGIWIIKLKDREYCPTFGAALCEDDWVLDMMEANDNHQEFHTCGEFVEFCLNGRTDKSGTWTSKGVGKYLEGGKEAGGQLVDQRFCPRIVEGEVRVLTSGTTCLQLIHKKPADGGISAVLGTGSVYTFYTPDEPKFAELKRKLFDEDLPKILPALGLENEPFPIIWTTDLIPYTDDDGKDQYTVGEFNCSCVGISKFQACAYPDKWIKDVKGEDLVEATMVADYAGLAAVQALRNKK